MLAGIDPVGSGLVASLARPGGNVTGITYEGGFEVSSKRIQILKELVPGLKRLGLFYNPDFPGMAGYREVWRSSAMALQIEVEEFQAHLERLRGRAAGDQEGAARRAVRWRRLAFGRSRSLSGFRLHH